MTHQRASRIILGFCAVAVVFVVPWWWHVMGAKNLRVRSDWLRPGDGRAHVEALLGRPSDERAGDEGLTVLVYRTSAQHAADDAVAWVRRHVWSGLEMAPGDPPVVIHLDAEQNLQRVER